MNRNILLLLLLCVCGIATSGGINIQVYNESYDNSNNTGGIVIDGVDLSGAYSGESIVIGSGVKGKVIREINHARRLNIDLSVDVSILIGAPATLTVEGDNNIVDLVFTRFHDKTLMLTSKKNYRATLPLKVVITLPEIMEISHESSGDIKISGLKNETIDFLLEGSGDVAAEGQSDYFEATLNDSGNLDLTQLVSRSGKVFITGSGDAEVSAIKTLNVIIDGSGDVYYSGLLKKISKQINGSGELIVR